jgi:hypothetical protein
MIMETFIRATLRLFAGTVTCINGTEAVDSESGAWLDRARNCVHSSRVGDCFGAELV